MEPLELFEAPARLLHQRLEHAAMVLRGFALPYVRKVMSAIDVIDAMSPFRHMATPGGFTMSTALTNCGAPGEFGVARLKCMGRLAASKPFDSTYSARSAS